MKKVITFGVFDYFHLGHLRLFEQAKQHGDYLIVAIQDDSSILKYKPETTICYSASQRAELVSALKIVDEVITYSDVDTDICKTEFDVFAVGEDQNHAGFKRAMEWCRQNGKEIAVLKRTRGISSTLIKSKLITDQ